MEKKVIYEDLWRGKRIGVTDLRSTILMIAEKDVKDKLWIFRWIEGIYLNCKSDVNLSFLFLPHDHHPTPT